MKRFTLVLFCILLCAAFAQAADIVFQWDAPTGGAQGYFLKYSLKPDLTAPTVLDTGANLTGTLTLAAGTYYVFATAYNRVLVNDQPTGPALESGPSNTVKVQVVLPPGVPGSARVGPITLVWNPPSGKTATIKVSGTAK